jgi:imidazoleglycerol phosphate dehydratase HisB
MAAAGRSGIRVDLRGSGAASVETGLPVFDRLLEQLAECTKFNLALEVEPGAAEAGWPAGRALGHALAEPLRADGARGTASHR